jgi:CBS domain-containing protein
MTHDVFIVQPDTPLMTAVGLLRRHRIGSLPVMKHKELVGIITRSDVLDFVLSGNGAAGRSKRSGKRRRVVKSKGRNGSRRRRS